MNDANITTDPGFSVNENGNSAIQIFGLGHIQFTDNNASNITSTGNSGLLTFAVGNNGGTNGAITITTDSTIQGTTGIFVGNLGGGAVTLDISSDVTGTTQDGIAVTNSGAGTDISITTAQNTTIQGSARGIDATNDGTGALTIDVSGDVIGTTVIGISARNNNGTFLSVTTGQDTMVQGSSNGIWARNSGSGAVTIDVSGDVSGASNSGIYALNNGGGTGVYITTAQNTNIVSLSRGIFSIHNGSGATTINASGSVRGALNEGIYSRSNGGGSVTIGISGDVVGGTNSILIGNNGTDDDDSLILRTGAGLSSPIGADMGDGVDTLTLVGNGDEDEVFLNTEVVEVNADATGWALSGTSTFDDINVNTGLFKNNGTLTVNNALTVDNGASFGGTGTTIGNITNNGTVGPGNSIGTQVINGNFVQGAGGTLTIEFDNTGIDLLDISGTATLAGTLNLVELAGGVTVKTPLTFLEADGGITGSFATTTQTFLMGTAITSATVDVGTNAATVTFFGGTGLDNVGQINNSRNVVAGLNGADASDNAAIVDIANALNSSPNADHALSSQAGTVTLNSIQALDAAIGDVNAVVQNRVSSTPTGMPAGDVISFDEGTMWTQIVGGFGDINSDHTAHGSDYTTYGAVAGVEVPLHADEATLGAFAAFSYTDNDVKSRIYTYIKALI